jgi:membrane glycosyltransferase
LGGADADRECGDEDGHDCNDELVTLPAKRPPDDAQRAWGARTRVAFGTGRRHFVHVWTAPRSPVARVVIAPLLLLATLLIITIGLLALLALVIVLLVAVFVLLVGTLVAAIRRNGDAASRRARGG